jgi:glycosyltransferase involved in cell wall biosynthesis
VYENQPLTPDSSFAVPRVNAQLLAMIAAEFENAEVIAASPAGESFAAVKGLDCEPSFGKRLGCRIRNSRPARMLPARFRSGSSLPHQRTHEAFRQLRDRPQPPTCLIASTYLPLLIGRNYLPQAKFIYWVHSLPRIGQEKLCFDAINQADVVVTASRAMYRELFNLYSRNCFAPPAWIISYQQPNSGYPKLSPDQRSHQRAELGLQDDEIAIVHVGRAAEKGLRVVESALAITAVGEKRVTLISVGASNKGERRLRNGVRVVEQGRVSPEALDRIYQACEFGVVPSVWLEAFGLVLVEMMSHGLCPIASRVGGIPEIVEHQRSGLLVDDPNDVKAWAATIELALADPSLRRRLGDQAMQRVEKQFSRERFFQAWLECLDAHL